MDAVFHIKGDEFDETFIKQIKSLLMSKKKLELTIAISEEPSNGFLREETRGQYFARLDKAIDNLNKGIAVTFTMDEFEEYTNQLVNES